jgi:hypothetical protein
MAGRSIHRGRGRVLPSEPMLHKSVQKRMIDLGYIPRAKFEKETYVE